MLSDNLGQVRTGANLLFGVVSRGDPRHPARKCTRGPAAVVGTVLGAHACPARRGAGKPRPYSVEWVPVTTACAAANRATGTLYGEHET